MFSFRNSALWEPPSRQLLYQLCRFLLCDKVGRLWRVDQNFDVQIEGEDVAGDAYVIEPHAQPHTGDGVILICLFAQQFIKLDELDLLPVLRHSGILLQVGTNRHNDYS